MKKILNKLKVGVAALLLFFTGWLGYRYQYGTEVSLQNFKTISSFCFIGDTGMGNKNQYRVAEKLNKDSCGAIFFLGDLIYPTGLKDENDPQFDLKFRKAYTSSASKFLVTGNHDSYSGTNSPWLKLAEKHDDLYMPYYYYSYKFGDTCVLVFDSFVYTTIKEGEYEKKQNKYVENFTNNKACKLKISVAHHPYLSSGKSHGDAGKELGTKRLKKFYEKYLVGKIDYSFGGHEHIISFEGEVKGTKFFVSGAGSKLNRCVDTKRNFCLASLGYLALDIKSHNHIIIRYEFLE